MTLTFGAVFIAYRRTRVQEGGRKMALAAFALLLGARASPVGHGDDRLSATPVPSPATVSPQERGRQFLQLIVALIRHADLRDTSFSSRILGTKIEKDQDVAWTSGSNLDSETLASGFSYDARPHMLSAIATFDFESSRTCVAKQDLYRVFLAEFGVGISLVPDFIGGKPVESSAKQGWMKLSNIVDASPNYFSIYRPLSDGMVIRAIGRIDNECLYTVILQQTKHGRVSQ